MIDETPSNDDVLHDDLRAILRELGLSDGARPYSAHEMVQWEILPAIRRLRWTRAICTRPHWREIEDVPVDGEWYL